MATNYLKLTDTGQVNLQYPGYRREFLRNNCLTGYFTKTTDNGQKNHYFFFNEQLESDSSTESCLNFLLFTIVKDNNICCIILLQFWLLLDQLQIEKKMYITDTETLARHPLSKSVRLGFTHGVHGSFMPRLA